MKRLVGMPGDTLYMRAGMLFVNGVAQRQGYGAQSRPGPNTSQPDETHPLFEWQHAIELKQSRFGAAPAQPTHDNWGPLVDPVAQLLHDGRRRYDSKDSRYWGVVPRENIRGRPIFVYYSYRGATTATVRSRSSPTSGGDASGPASTERIQLTASTMAVTAAPREHRRRG